MWWFIGGLALGVVLGIAVLVWWFNKYIGGF